MVEETSAQTQFVIEDEDEDDEEGEEEDDNPRVPKTPQQTGSQLAQEKPKETLPSVAERLFSCLIDLMFCCGFTLPTKIQVDHYKINYVIWCACCLDHPWLTSAYMVARICQGEGRWFYDRPWA